MKLNIDYRGFDWIIIITDYEYIDFSPPSQYDPGCSEEVRILDGYIQWDHAGALCAKINKQLYEAGFGALMRHIIKVKQNTIITQTLAIVTDRMEAQDRDYELEAEEFEWQRLEAFKNMEIEW
jgi:hypothetical protein